MEVIVRGKIWCLMALGILCAGCHHIDEPHTNEKLTLRLSALPIGESGRYRLIAEAEGPLAGLKYRFYSDDGACEPEISERPESVFSPPPGAKNEAIKVTVEALRDDVPVQSAHYTIRVSAAVAGPHPPEPAAIEPTPGTPQEPSASGGAAVEITRIPGYDPSGGPDSRNDIAGVVRGVADPEAYRVVLYARTDLWYVQPLLGSTIQINSDGTWSSWTHGGAEYGALLVRRGYRPSSTLGALPAKDGARVIAETQRTGTR